MKPESDLIIDCDVHCEPTDRLPLTPFIPKEILKAYLEGGRTVPSNGYGSPLGLTRKDVAFATPQDFIKHHLEPNHIAYAVIQHPGRKASIYRSIDIGNAVAQAWNDWLIEHFLSNDRRFLGSIAVNPNDPAAAVKEIRRVGEHPQMVQVLMTSETEFLLGHRILDPIYAVCQEMNLPLAIHPGQEGSLKSPTPCGHPSTYLEWHSIIPINYQAHLCSMVCEGVFEKFKNLKVLLTEGGIAWLPALMWRMDKNFKGLRVNAPWLREKPSDYILRHVRLTTQPAEEPPKDAWLADIFEMVDAEKTVCFSSDFPHWDFDDPFRCFPSSLPETLKTRIYYDNAAELYGLPKRDFLITSRSTTIQVAS
jgi:uncharacterized protein